MALWRSAMRVAAPRSALLNSMWTRSDILLPFPPPPPPACFMSPGVTSCVLAESLMCSSMTWNLARTSASLWLIYNVLLV